MNDVMITPDGQELPLTLKPNARAKRISLRFSSRDGSLLLSYPPMTGKRTLADFLEKCRPWVEKQTRKLTRSSPLSHQKKVCLYGTSFQIASDPLRRKPALCKASQSLFLPKRYAPTDLTTLFKKEALETLSPIVKEAALTIGHKVAKITIRDQSTRWGSCSANKTISLNWRLLLAPPEVATYVCAHEVAHLEEMNHSKAFWDLVEHLHPSYKPHRKWLKEHGKSLMAFRVG